MIMNFSCNNCRRAKRKCDRQLPSCSLCLKRGKNCSYATSDGRKPATHGYIKALLTRIKTLESSLNRLRATDAVNSGTLNQFTESMSPVLNFDPALNHLHPLNEETGIPLSDAFDFSTTTTTSSSRTNSLFGNNSSREFLNNSSLFNSGLEEESSPFRQNDVVFPFANKFELNITNLGDRNVHNPSISFHGPSSMRFLKNDFQLSEPTSSEESEPPKLSTSINEFVDQYHKEIFTWFFFKMNQTFPLVDEHLFFISLNNAIRSHHNEVENGDLGEYSSNSLINAMMSFYFLYKEQFKDYENFKKLAIEQLDFEIRSSGKKKLKITNVQTLILLSILSMTIGDEIEGSQYCARAISLSNHLGLHLKSETLIKNGIISIEEFKLRENVYCCCYLTDKINSTILGISPYMEAADRNNYDAASNSSSNFSELKTFNESLSYYSKEIEIIAKCYNSSNLPDEDIETFLIDQKLAVSSASLTYHQWKKDMDSGARFRNNKSSPALFLEISRLTLLVLIYKTILLQSKDHRSLNSIFNVDLLVSPNKDSDDEYPQGSAVNTDLDVVFQGVSDSDNNCDSASCVCLDSSKKIIKLCLESNEAIIDNLYIYRTVYGIYVASLIVLYNITSSDPVIRKGSIRYFKNGLRLLSQYKSFVKISTTYIENLYSYSKEWFEMSFVQELFQNESEEILEV